MKARITAAFRRLRYFLLGTAYDVLALPREAALEIRTDRPIGIRFELTDRGPRFFLESGDRPTIVDLQDAGAPIVIVDGDGPLPAAYRDDAVDWIEDVLGVALEDWQRTALRLRQRGSSAPARRLRAIRRAYGPAEDDVDLERYREPRLDADPRAFEVGSGGAA